MHRFSTEEEAVQTRSDGSGVSPDDRNALLGPGFAPPAAARAGSPSLEELARAVEDDLATPDLAPATERAYAHDWADF